MTTAVRPKSDSRAIELADLVERLTARIQARESIDFEAVRREHPEHAGELERLIPALALLADFSRTPGSALPTADGDSECGTLGDFRLIREIGRGGMGIVYEAEQISLNRRVALKVLPFAATMDPRHMQRFKNEALAAASLRHENIVHVYGVGCERGVHYYAMELIEGQTLAEVIAEINEEKKLNHRDTEDTEKREKTIPKSSLCSLCLCGKKSSFFRSIATLIASAADALEYAHSMGVVHRDVKPGNLMLDFSPLPASGRGAGGEGCHLWITDFGLAKLANPAREGGGELTMTGDLLGTLRYMSPEQALAKHGLVDHRTDIYSLGATLYELLTLHPAVAGADKAEILKSIAWDEPTPLRKHDKSIPAELETITMKCLAKEPSERYATAGELAEDLRRWLGDHAIKAKPPGWREKAAKWGRRHPGIVAGLGLVVGLALSVGWAWHREKTNSEIAAMAVAVEAEKLRDASKLPEALQAARRAVDLLPRFGGDAQLRSNLERIVADTQLLFQLDQARLERAITIGSDNKFDDIGALELYQAAFRNYGVDLLHVNEQVAIEFLQCSAVASQLVGVLTEWVWLTPSKVEEDRLSRIVEALDANPRRIAARMVRARVSDLVAMAREAEADMPTSPLVEQLGRLLWKHGFATECEQLLRQALKQYPNDFWLNAALAEILPSGQETEKVRYWTAAIAIRPESAGAHFNLGLRLSDLGRRADAADSFRRATEIAPNYGVAFHNLAVHLWELNRRIEAEEAARRAVELMPTESYAHAMLGKCLTARGLYADAEASYRRALEQNPCLANARGRLALDLMRQSRISEAIDEAYQTLDLDSESLDAYMTLGAAYDRLQRFAESESAFRRHVEIKPNSPGAHLNHGIALRKLGRTGESEAAFRKALEFGPTNPNSHYALGLTLQDLFQCRDAEACFRQAIEINPKFAGALNSLGALLCNAGRVNDGLIYLHRAIELEPANAQYLSNRGIALRELGHFAEAEVSFRESIRLRPKNPEALANLGIAFCAQARYEESLESFRSVQESGSGELATFKFKDAERILAVAKKTPAVLLEKAEPATADEKLALAMVLSAKGRHQAAAELFNAALKSDETLKAYRLNAAVEAVWAATGNAENGREAGVAERPVLRRLALQWLMADLAEWKKELALSQSGRTVLGHGKLLLDNRLFISVRDPIVISQFPDNERIAWQRFWADLAEFVRESEGGQSAQTARDLD